MKSKITIKSQDEHRWGELRVENGGCNILVIASKNGWFYGYDIVGQPPRSGYKRDTTGLNVRVSMNGVWSGTFEQWNEVLELIEDLKAQIIG